MADKHTAVMALPGNLTGPCLDLRTWAATWSEADGWVIYVPPMGTPATPQAWALYAAFVRLEQEQEFREECRAWLHEQRVAKREK